MDLHDHLTETLDRLDETGPDLVALTRTARTRGTRLRRRRTAGLAAAGCVAVLGLVGGIALVSPGGDDPAVVATDPGIPAPAVVRPGPAVPSGPVVEPATGQAGALALQWAVDQQRAGAASDLAGQHGYYELRWDDADGLGASVVGINVQDDMSGLPCPKPVALCTDVTAPDGSRLVTYEERTREPGGTSIRRVVDLYRADGIRVVVSATNGFEHGGGRWDLTRAAPPLTRADLEAIVRQPLWGLDLPGSFVQAGDSLTGYTDYDAGTTTGTTAGFSPVDGLMPASGQPAEPSPGS